MSGKAYGWLVSEGREYAEVYSMVGKGKRISPGKEIYHTLEVVCSGAASAGMRHGILRIPGAFTRGGLSAGFGME